MNWDRASAHRPSKYIASIYMQMLLLLLLLFCFNGSLFKSFFFLINFECGLFVTPSFSPFVSCFIFAFAPSAKHAHFEIIDFSTIIKVINVKSMWFWIFTSVSSSKWQCCQANGQWLRHRHSSTAQFNCQTLFERQPIKRFSMLRSTIND